MARESNETKRGRSSVTLLKGRVLIWNDGLYEYGRTVQTYNRQYRNRQNMKNILVNYLELTPERAQQLVDRTFAPPPRPRRQTHLTDKPLHLVARKRTVKRRTGE